MPGARTASASSRSGRASKPCPRGPEPAAIPWWGSTRNFRNPRNINDAIRRDFRIPNIPNRSACIFRADSLHSMTMNSRLTRECRSVHYPRAPRIGPGAIGRIIVDRAEERSTSSLQLRYDRASRGRAAERSRRSHAEPDPLPVRRTPARHSPCCERRARATIDPAATPLTLGK